jgi:hypothetical protein
MIRMELRRSRRKRSKKKCRGSPLRLPLRKGLRVPSY